jgi:hypothetical protein
MMLRRIAAATAAALGLAAALVTTAPTASATARDGVCETGEFCLYYNSDHLGSRVDLVNSQRDYGSGAGCITFVSAGAGQGQCVKNNTASVWNRTGKPVFVFFNSDYGGVYDQIPDGAKVNLNANVKNDNASQIIGDASLRFPLNTTQAHIKSRSPMWCWDSRTNCHHDYNAADIFAATVKDSFNRLWYFAHLHNSPAPVVSVGRSVGKGTRLGTVGTSAHAAGTPPHLHIDMRVGVDSRVSCSGAACASFGFVNNQPLLRTAFLEIP